MGGFSISQEEIESWVEKAKQGKTMKEVSVETGRSISSIYKLTPRGLFNNRGGIRKEERIKINETDAAYFAGIIDGEGTIGFSRIKRGSKIFIAPIVSVCNTDKLIVNRIQEIYPIGNIHERKRKKEWKLTYTWYISRIFSVYYLLEQIVPYLSSSKKDRAYIVMEFCKLRMKRSPYGEFELKLYEKLYSF